MSDRTATLTAVLIDSVSGPGRQIQATVVGIGDSVSKMSAVLTGIGVGIGEQIFNRITNAVDTLVHALPNLIDAGDQYLEQLHQVQLETGLTAEQTSVLVGVTKSLGISTDNLEPLFAKLGKSLGTSEGNFRALGVATRDSNGNMLGAYQIIQNLREQVSLHGEALLSSAAAQTLFGRGGYQLLPLLQMSDAQFKVATASVERWGGVMSQEAIDGAHKFSVELSSLQTGILDIGTNIFAALSPYLSAFVDAFSHFVQAHLQEIISFAVSVAATITGFVGGLLGFTVDFSKVSDAGYHAAAGTDTFGQSVKGAAAGTDAFTTSVNAHIKAIDAQITAETRATQLRQAARERERLDRSLDTAQGQLADLKGNSPFLGGLSAAEQALAVQKHAQDVIDAQKNVHDAATAIGDFEANQKDVAERELLNREKQRLTESLAAHKATNAAILASGLQMGAGLDKGLGTAIANIGLKTQELGQTAAASFQTGTDAAQAFLDLLLGAQGPATGPHDPGVRTGGVVGALGDVGAAIFGVGAKSAGAFGDIRTLGTDLGNLGSALGDLDMTIHGFIDSIRAIVGRLIGDIQSLPSDLFRDLTHLPVPWDNAPKGASGAFVPSQPGGVVMRIGEGSEDEWVIPRSKMGGGQTINITLNAEFLSTPSDEQIRTVTDKISRRLAFNLANTGASSRPAGAF